MQGDARDHLTRPGLELSVKRAEELLKGVMIPPQPTILVSVLNERSKPDPDLERIGDVISGDVALAASMLKVVNSPFFGLRRRIGSIHHAVRLLGLGNVVNIASGLMLKAAFADQRGPFMDAFWRSSSKLAVVSTMVARDLRVASPEDSYAVGLFANCGVPILRRRFDNYSDLYAAAQVDEAQSFTDHEEDALGTNHAVVGYMMANGWMLPDAFGDAILNHHDTDAGFIGPAEEGSAGTRLAGVLHVAQHVVRQVDGYPVSHEWTTGSEAIMAYFGIGENTIEQLTADVRALPPEVFGSF